MHLNTPTALYLLVGTLSNALPSPQNDPSPTIDVPSTTTLPTVASSDVSIAADQLDQLSNFAQQLANSTLAENSQKRGLFSGQCNLFNVAVRREWNLLTLKERKEYTDAVKCLQSKTAKTPSSLVPGAKSRFDDWIATHINQTMTIHYTGTFLAWHRYFTWQYEQALRNECGYKGYQPYWNWGLTAATGLENSPMLDGSEYSMSGNGEYIPNQGDINLGGNGLPDLILPAGSGGGCVTSGPFKDMTVNLGPTALGIPGGETISNGDGLSYNPRCLKRDLTNYANQRFANASSIVRLILGTHEINDFQMTMQGIPGSGDIGVHGGGHYSMGGDPGRDLFVSPGDPLFYLHHANIDRTWWIWQSLDKNTRTGAQGIAGTGTFLNQPPSPDTTLETPIDLGYAAGPVQTMADLMDTTAGPFCYIYI
ncbi:Di-copper centre-containing protein [Lojkania enalia]|uniref:Di-copper centre-containing protein n=1 Tax=Lojkania enalia TaxID=147567 RepID=A0A9P4TRZ5_9PLEO|nr:Di-copper centre-containing protein [Didymosphaeria enalia]